MKLHALLAMLATFAAFPAHAAASDGSLAARIEGEVQGKPRAIDFPMRRIACPAG